MTAAHDWELWSTSGRLVVTEEATLGPAIRLVDELLAEVEMAASRFRPDAEIMNLEPGTDGTTSVSPMLADLLDEALDAARQTDGAVDPTVGGTLSDLGYDRDIRLVLDGDRPTATIRPVPGWRRLRLAGNRLSMPSGIELDLGATAKAVAADRCALLVASELGTGVLVALGGDIATSGPAPAGDWQITVQDTPQDPATVISLPGGTAVATSSTVRRRWRQGGRDVHHIIDPTTARPAPDLWRSVTVAALTCVQANAAATATIAKGHAGLAWLTDQGLPARLVDNQGRVHLINDWPKEIAA